MGRTLLVTGASGHLGRLVIEQLVNSGSGDKVVAATRNSSKFQPIAGVEVRRADFDDAASLDVAFQGVDRLLIVSTDALDANLTRARQHTAAIAAAKRAGVKHVLYTSLTRADTSSLVLAPDHKATEEALKASGLGYTILRHNWYAQLLLGSVPAAVKSGQLYSAAGEGRIAYLTREDCAVADAAALSSTFDGKRVLEVTGAEALTHAQVAALASEISGKPVAVVPVTEAQLADGMKHAGLPPPIAAMFASVDTSVKGGALELVSGDFGTLTGRPQTSVRAFLEANRAAFAA